MVCLHRYMFIDMAETVQSPALWFWVLANKEVVQVAHELFTFRVHGVTVTVTLLKLLASTVLLRTLWTHPIQGWLLIRFVVRHPKGLRNVTAICVESIVGIYSRLGCCVGKRCFGIQISRIVSLWEILCCIVPILSRRSFLENRMFPLTLAVFYLGLCIHTIERALLSSTLTNKSFHPADCLSDALVILAGTIWIADCSAAIEQRIEAVIEQHSTLFLVSFGVDLIDTCHVGDPTTTGRYSDILHVYNSPEAVLF